MTSLRSTWVTKFAFAINGLIRSVRQQISFWVHLPMAVAVIAVAAWLNVETWRWGLLVLAISLVLVAELINTAIEQMVRVLHPQQDQRIGEALDAAAAAVLIASIAAVTVGLITLGPPLWDALMA